MKAWKKAEFLNNNMYIKENLAPFLLCAQQLMHFLPSFVLPNGGLPRRNNESFRCKQEGLHLSH